MRLEQAYTQAFSLFVCQFRQDHIICHLQAHFAPGSHFFNIPFGKESFCHTCLLRQISRYAPGIPSSASSAATAAFFAVMISASLPESHIRPKRPTEEM